MRSDSGSVFSDLSFSLRGMLSFFAKIMRCFKRHCCFVKVFADRVIIMNFGVPKNVCAFRCCCCCYCTKEAAG